MPTTCHLTAWLSLRPGLSLKTMLHRLHFRPSTHSCEVVERACSFPTNGNTTNVKYNTFEYHAILVTAPVKIYMVVVYRLPGQLGDFLDELDSLLSSIPEHGCPIMVLGDMNIHLDSPNSSDFLSLMHSFEL